ncbi:MAG: hypothetical protein ACFFCW_43835 [Candidatus Hodarchaeota archaeon]
MKMQDILSKIKKEIPFSESEPWGQGKEVISMKMREFMNDLAKEIRIRNDPENLSGINRIGGWFFPSLIAIVFLSLNKQWLHPDIKIDLQKIIMAIYNIEAKHWEQQSKQSKKTPSIQSFLAAERLKDSEWKDLKDELKIPSFWPEDVNFSNLYRACALAQARLIDVQHDASFLIDLIKRLAGTDISKTILLPYINGVAEGAIVRKTFYYDKSKRKAIAEHLIKVNYMMEFSEVLEKLLERWEITS